MQSKPQSSPSDPPTAPPTVWTPPTNQSRNGREAYNIVADTIAGPNVRLKDNLYQGLFILGFLVLGVIVGLMIAGPDYRMAGAMVGGLVGMFAGLIISGVFIMILRGVRHARGRHD